jgi:hypothetical protein
VEIEMSSKLSVEEVLANLERRAVFHREQEAFHAQKAAQHQAEQAHHAAELEKVLQSLEAFRAVVSVAVDLAQPVQKPAEPAAEIEEADLPAPGRLMVGRLIRLVVDRPGLAEPFGATAVAAEANRRFAAHLRQPIQSRTASDVLRRMLGEGRLQVSRKGKALHEALYVRNRPS